jgi:hypothetical protein
MSNFESAKRAPKRTLITLLSPIRDYQYRH